jgi:hypothetical protein
MLQSMKAVRRPKGMRPEDLYKNSSDRTSTTRQFSADKPLNTLKEGGCSPTLTDSSSSKDNFANQGY